MSGSLSADVTVESPILRSSRVKQVESMFDIPPAETEQRAWQVSLPLDEQEWSLGLIVGPSGAGKSTVTRAFWPHFEDAHEWDPAKAVVDCFPGDISIKEVVGALTAVGFGSPPSWLRPYQTLSTGERFRADVAFAIASATEGQPVVIDEYTSTVDRQVAQIASHAVQKTIRRSGKQLIAVTCHYDVLDWLQPDWVYQPHLGEFTWRCLQPRPSVDLQIYPVDRAVWDVFSRHHYLSSNLHVGAHCFGGFVDGQIVAFHSWIRFPHPTAKNIMKGHRHVVLPDWQGLGIAGHMCNWGGQYLYEQGERYHHTVAHPAMDLVSQAFTALASGKRWGRRRIGTIAAGRVSACPCLGNWREVHPKAGEPQSSLAPAFHLQLRPAGARVRCLHGDAIVSYKGETYDAAMSGDARICGTQTAASASDRV